MPQETDTEKLPINALAAERFHLLANELAEREGVTPQDVADAMLTIALHLHSVANSPWFTCRHLTRLAILMTNHLPCRDETKH